MSSARAQQHQQQQAQEQQQPPVATAQPRPSMANRAAALLRARGPLPFGYHNTFHTHASDASPPSYEHSKHTRPARPSPMPEDPSIPPPAYTCSVLKSGVAGLLIEFRDVHLSTPCEKRWQDMFVVLRGTSLSIHFIKFRLQSKKSIPQPGKKIASFSLQHAEVGLALDIRPEENSPKNNAINLLPANVKNKLIKSKPHLFETKREWLLRLRIEGFQLVLSLNNEESLMDWCEQLCAAIDIAPPIDDRSDPRYRSLPRRSRRQRQLENYFADPVPLAMHSFSDQVIEQQERILRTLYPNLASNPAADRRSVMPPARPTSNYIEQPTSGDQDMDEFDRDDVTEQRDENALPRSACGADDQAGKRRPSQRQATSVEVEIRFRRRCMPIMYKYSPRSSEVVFVNGKRQRVDLKRGITKPFELAPPRYPRPLQRADREHSRPQSHLRTDSDRHAVRRIQSQNLSVPPNEDGSLAFRTLSGYSMRVDSDAVSIRSVAGMTIGSTHDGIEPVSTRASMLNSSGDMSDEPNSPDAAMMLALKEKSMTYLRNSRQSQEDQVSHGVASLVL